MGKIGGVKNVDVLKNLTMLLGFENRYPGKTVRICESSRYDF